MPFSLEIARSHVGKRVKTTRGYPAIPEGSLGTVIGAGPTRNPDSAEIVVHIEFALRKRSIPCDTHYSLRDEKHEFTGDEWDNSIEVQQAA